ncbi:MAG: hypothetical protein ACREHV_00940 [Rhizomicrobium sp.]
MTDATTTAAATTAAAAAPAAPAIPSLETIVANVKATLSADGQKVVAFFEAIEQDTAEVLGRLGAGGQAFIGDVETLLANINSKIGIVNAVAASASATLAAVAPGNTTLQTIVAKVQSGLQDAGQVSVGLQSDSTAGDSAPVTTAVTTLQAVNSLLSDASQVSAMLNALTAANAPAVVTPASPSPTA